MNINVIYRNGVFVPCYDEDYEKAKKLKHNIPLSIKVSTLRNPELNKKYHTLINRAWNCFDESQTAFFGEGGKEAFRKSMEVTAGFFEPMFSFNEKEWHKAPKSTAFDKMSEEEFEELYARVYDAIRALLTRKTLTDQQFDTIFEGF